MIGAWLGVAFVLGASARTIPTGALRGLIGLLAAVAVYYLLIAILGRAIGPSGPGTRPPSGAWSRSWPDRSWAAPARSGGTARAGRGRSAVAVLAAALIAEGVVFGVTRLVHLDQIGNDPGALLYAAEMLIGLALPAVLLRKGERFRGYAVTAGFAILAAVAIGPVTADPAEPRRPVLKDGPVTDRSDMSRSHRTRRIESLTTRSPTR